MTEFMRDDRVSRFRRGKALPLDSSTRRVYFL
ncbi:MAG: hypothetical protein JWN41_645 [Thermoleophilia bacterium]|nr:hypothetical protein [Thermoleophilia bacterium]